MENETRETPPVPSPRVGRPSSAVALGIAYALAVAVFDLFTTSAVGVGFMALAPLLCAAMGGSPTQTVWVTTTTVALTLALGVPDDIFGELLHFSLLAGDLLAGFAAAFLAALRERAEHDRLRAEMQYAVAATLLESSTLREAALRLLQAVGEPLGWVAGGLWEVRADRSLACVETWHTEGVELGGFGDLSRGLEMREGHGMPGKVLAADTALWMWDVTADPELPRGDAAAAAGLRGAVAFPLRTSAGIAGVIELFDRDPRVPDNAVLDLLGAVGGQIGEFLEASRSGALLSAAEARKSAMLEAALDSVITIDHKGHVVELNPAAELTFGYPRKAAIGREMAELVVPPDLREDHRKALARCVETGEGALLGRRIELRAMRADSTEFPIELTITRIGLADPPMFTGFIRDITERKAAEQERERLHESERLARFDADRAREQLTAILSGVADAVTAQAPDGNLVFANESAVEMLGFPSVEALLAAPVDEVRDRFEAYDEDGEPFPVEQLPGRLALMGTSTEAVIRYVDTRDASERWSKVKATPIFDEDGRVAMAINVIEDVTDLKRSEESQRLLAEVGRILASSLSTERVLQRVAGLATAPWLADWCSIHTLTPEGEQEIAAWASADEERGRGLLEIIERFPREPDEAVLIDENATDEAHRELIAQTGAYTAALAPVSSRGGVLGALTLVRFGGGRGHDALDLAVAEELGRRIGSWLDTANLYAERSHIARTLQESLLPARLPDIPGLTTAARFRASGAGNEVGGDFYDLFQATGGSWSVIVGDVCGKGPDAAAVTALARYTLRAAAMREPRPSAGLRVLNEALLQQRNDLRFCHRGLRVTRALGRRDARGGRERGPSPAHAAPRRRHRRARGVRGHAGGRGPGSGPRGQLDQARPGRLARLLYGRRNRRPGRERDLRGGAPRAAPARLRRDGCRGHRVERGGRRGGDAGG